jgi:protein required for attachment to host cells
MAGMSRAQTMRKVTPMPHRKIQTGDWVVVCDGGKSLILENMGDDKFPNLRMKETRTQENPPTREQGRSAPGRVHESAGTAHSAVENHDLHTAAERAFLEELAERLDKAVTAGEIRHLVVVAPPRALGMIRHAYTDAVRDALLAEMDKDLTKLPIYEIEKHVIQ